MSCLMLRNGSRKLLLEYQTKKFVRGDSIGAKRRDLYWHDVIEIKDENIKWTYRLPEKRAVHAKVDVNAPTESSWVDPLGTVRESIIRKIEESLAI
jgi:hypothetical protein